MPAKSILILIILLCTNVLSFSVQADTSEFSVDVTYQQLTFIFDQSITIYANFASNQEITGVYLFLQPVGQSARVEKVDFEPEGTLEHTYTINTGEFKPFSTIDYWIRFETPSGSSATSPIYSFIYNDNRFVWNDLENTHFRVFWYNRDIKFGQTLLDAAAQGISSINMLFEASITDPVDIYVYASGEDLRSSIKLTGLSWVAGQASPESNLIMLAIPPGPDEQINLERQVPHELAHVLLYQKFLSGYAQFPVWLREGIASMAELYPNPEYSRVLRMARDRDTLISISSLCNSFPREANLAYLAYATADSFTRFLYDQFGKSKIQSLMLSYADGIGCEEAVEQTLGETLDRLDTRWQQEILGIQVEKMAARNLMPYIVLIGLVAVVVMLPGLLTRKNKEEA